MGVTFDIAPLGEDGLLLRFADTLDLGANQMAIDVAEHLRSQNLPGVLEIAPALVSDSVRIDLSNFCVRQRIDSFHHFLKQVVDLTSYVD